MMDLNAKSKHPWNPDLILRKIFGTTKGTRLPEARDPDSIWCCMSVFRLMAVFGSVSLLLCAGTANAQQTSQAVGIGLPAAVQAGQAAPPRCDANCVRENAAKAAEACAPRIEAQAPTDFDWITRPNPGIFQQADPSSPADAIVRYRGDSLRFMAADKSWTRVSYECGYDVSTQTVAYAKVRSGRLDQPLVSAVPQDKPAAPPKPPVAQAAASIPASPQTAAAPRPPKPRVGEPSLIVIQQQSPNPKSH
jgi:hypothetical protein